MPNMKLFGNEIESISRNLRKNISMSQVDLAETNFKSLLAIMDLANDPAYENLEQFPEDMDVEDEIDKRIKVLEDNETFREATYLSLNGITKMVCRPRKEWEDEDIPEMLPVDMIQKNLDEAKKRTQAELDEIREKYRISANGTVPNASVFGYAIEKAGKFLDENLPKLTGGRVLFDYEIKGIGVRCSNWMALIEAANDPKNANLRAQNSPKTDDLRTKTKAFDFRYTAVFEELFSPGREKDVLHIFYGWPGQWKNGKPTTLLRYDEMKKNLDEKVKQIEAEMVAERTDDLFEKALKSQGEERSRAIANIIILNNRYEESRKKGKDIDIFNKRAITFLVNQRLGVDSFVSVTGGDQLVEFLKDRDVKGLGQALTHKQFEFTQAKKAEKKRAEKENVLRAREEAERKNALTDEEVAGLNMTETADKLYSEIVKLGEPLSAAYGNKWMGEVEKAQSYFVDYKGSDGFKKGVEDAQKFLDTKLSDGKTIGQFAKEERLLGANFKKLMDRADEITSPTKTAASWIEEHKAELANRIRGNQRGDNYPAADIARIFAARELSNSVRGKKSTLGESISDYKINKRAAEIMENKSFKDFAAKLSKGENLSKVEAIFKKTHSHGGELDDMFRDYLTKRPAGELENDPKLKRWMPTVKQRVEFLQSEAAKVQKENKTPYKEAAEILLLRQAAEVKRGGKGLEANVPVIGEKGVTSLQASVKNYTNDAKFKEAFDQPDVKKYILSGHGGEMAERYNKQPEAKKIQQKNEQEVGK